MQSIFVSSSPDRLNWFHKSIEEIPNSSLDFNFSLAPQLNYKEISTDENVVFFDLSENPDEKSFSELKNLAAKFTGKIVAVGNAQKSMDVLQSLRAGACDYLDTTHLAKDLNEIWSRILKDVPAKPTSGKIVLVMSANGGVGKSTIAANLAVAVNQALKQKVTLVDFDFDHGDIAPLLHLNPTFTVADLMRPNITVDTDMFERTLTPYEKTGVHVLAAPANLNLNAVYSEEAILKTLDQCRASAPLTIIDMPGGYSEIGQKVIEKADLVLVVNRLEFQSIRNTSRFLEFETRECRLPATKFQILLNRKGEPYEVEMSKAQEVLNCDLAWSLPNDPKAANLAGNVGVPVVVDSPHSALAAAFHNTAEMLMQKLQLVIRPDKKPAHSGFATKLPGFIASFMM